MGILVLKFTNNYYNKQCAYKCKRRGVIRPTLSIMHFPRHHSFWTFPKVFISKEILYNLK